MASQRRNLIFSVLFVVFGGPGIVLIYLPLWITRFRIPADEPMWQILIAAMLILAGLTPGLESVRRFIYVGRGTLVPIAPPKHLVVSGFYRYVRNPMYVGVMVALTGEVILFWTRGLVIEALLAFLGFNLFIRLHEEPSLTRRHPEEYPRYKRNVPRWLPRLTPWNGSQA
ncbi:MAG TPA: isoprenylcysteine carboxylmethyltransferase family protein [Terracidiphilus sp.]|nr:isoprenylcysteine carboxylmethyltransferase family protein [Terracidiphilus sp.]